MAVFKAYFVDGLNIAKIPVLVGIAESAGLRGVEDILSEGTFKEEVDKDWKYSRRCGSNFRKINLRFSQAQRIV